MHQMTLQFDDGAPFQRALLQSEPDTADWPRLLHSLRWQLGLSQAAFCGRYRLDPAEIAAIEAGVAAPCGVLAAYLTIIERAPALVARVCASKP